MKVKTNRFISIVLALFLVVGCFAALLQTTNAADNSVYTLTAWVDDTRSTNTIYRNGASAPAISTLMKLVNDNDGTVIYAMCVNQTITTDLNIKYQLVDLNNYPNLTPTQKTQILTLLNYISINYGLDTKEGTALAQTVIWRIIHPDIDYIIPQQGVGITKEDIDNVYAHINDLPLNYNFNVAIEGTANKPTHKDTNYSYYGPFSVTYNPDLSDMDHRLSDMNFDLTFTPTKTESIFTDKTYTEINQVKQGMDFYVGVPNDTTETTLSFNAAASTGVNLITGINFLVSTSGTNQPLVVYQPLVQPLVNHETTLYHYSCNASFTLAPQVLNGTLTINTETGTKVNIKDSITGGYTKEAIPDAKGKYDHATYKHNLETALGSKGNWFQYNEFTTGTSQHFDLVQGDKLNLVGGYTITYNPTTNEFTLTLDDALIASGAQLSISNTIQAAKNKNDKTYNVNNIWTSAPGQQQFSFNGHSYTFKANWVDPSKPVYIYLHLDGLTGYTNTNGTNIGDTYTINVIDKDTNTIIASKTLTITSGTTSLLGSVTFDNLKPGQYTIEVAGSKGTKLYTTDTEIKPNETTTIKLGNLQ